MTGYKQEIEEIIKILQKDYRPEDKESFDFRKTTQKLTHLIETALRKGHDYTPKDKKGERE